MEFWATLLGAAVGVVAGTFIQFLVQALIEKRAEKAQRSDLKKEMQCNLDLTSVLLNECSNLRNAINGDDLPSYFGYLNYERGIFYQSNNLLSKGLIYRWFEIDTIRKLQHTAFKLTVYNANWVNNGITERREAAKAGTAYSKSEAVAFVNFVENDLKSTSAMITDVISKI